MDRAAVRPPKLVICDLDNTLYDWVAYFVPSFYAMVDVAVEVLRCERELLLDDLRFVHQQHHDSEHPFALLEARVVTERFKERSRAEAKQALDKAFHAFNVNRKQTLRAYPGTEDALRALTSEGVQLVAHTESNLFAVVDRLRRLNLYRFFTKIYCRERPESVHPDGDRSESFFSAFPLDRVVELSRHQRKPNVAVLREICSGVGVDMASVAYVGDSLTRDVKMAVDAGAIAMWAKYGTVHAPGLYEKLVRVTHWTDEDVQREKRLSETSRDIRPDFVAESSLLDILAPLGLSPQIPAATS